MIAARLAPCAVLLLAMTPWPRLTAQDPAALQPSRFAGTWVGTQSWAIANPPPGARADQPVALTIEVVDGRMTGTMTPFLGGEEGASFTEAAIVGEELRATAVIGGSRPRVDAGDPDAAPGAGRGGRRGGGPGNWKDAVVVTFTFRNDGVRLEGRADVRLGDVPWLAFTYDLGRKRSRY
jgi:hypothetical protein